jgi:hypothetical protein
VPPPLLVGLISRPTPLYIGLLYVLLVGPDLQKNGARDFGRAPPGFSRVIGPHQNHPALPKAPEIFFLDRRIWWGPLFSGSVSVLVDLASLLVGPSLCLAFGGVIRAFGVMATGFGGVIRAFGVMATGFGGVKPTSGGVISAPFSLRPAFGWVKAHFR